jgi:hypothetical protein
MRTKLSPSEPKQVERQDQILMTHEEALTAHELAQELGKISVGVVRRPGEGYRKEFKNGGARVQIDDIVPKGKVLTSISGTFPKPEANHSIGEFRQQVVERTRFNNDAEAAGLGPTLREIRNLPESKGPNN